jgi:hypothetical protein
MSTLVYYDGDLLGTLVRDKEASKLTVEELLDAIYDNCRYVVRYPNGKYTLADQSSRDYKLVDDTITPADTPPKVRRKRKAA